MSPLPTLCVTGKLEWIYCAGSTGRSTHYALLTLERSSNGTELDTLTHWYGPGVRWEQESSLLILGHLEELSHHPSCLPDVHSLLALLIIQIYLWGHSAGLAMASESAKVHATQIHQVCTFVHFNLIQFWFSMRHKQLNKQYSFHLNRSKIKWYWYFILNKVSRFHITIFGNILNILQSLSYFKITVVISIIMFKRENFHTSNVKL